MLAGLHKVSKAIAAGVAGPAIIWFTDYAGTVAGVTEDGSIVTDEWKLLLAAPLLFLVTFLAPKNEEPPPAPDPDNRL